MTSLSLSPVNKQLRDKERVSAACENPVLMKTIKSCIFDFESKIKDTNSCDEKKASKHQDKYQQIMDRVTYESSLPEYSLLYNLNEKDIEFKEIFNNLNI